ncbi:hypothetical protein [Leptolyngbya sp. FACHB-261]|uniref:hypothetical protein n=1 Tax=Leptolyngbya sp. FACHB-261 TaxID=2692806 RepID=UPI0016834432|nr:hypothetical protein [Leptolyngbya sp. FACHB-261]MBD2102478.1 hypothetical protein [Leptolyngbya sp. FACHB-261]
MSQSDINAAIPAAFKHWLSQQILKLSVETLSSEVLTCTACSASTSGEYIVEYGGESFRYSPEKTYAFLKFVAEGGAGKLLER